MIENMSVGVKITLTNDATPKLKLFLDQINKINIAVEALNERLKFTTGAFADLGKSFASSSNTLSRLNEKLSYTSKHMADAARNAVVFRQSLNGLGAGGGRRGGGHGGLAGSIGREAGGGHFGGFLSGAAFGGMSPPLLAGGLGALMLGKSSFEAYGRYQNAQAQFAGQGFGAAANSSADYMATHSQIRGVSSTDMLHAITDASTVTRDPKQALALAPLIAKMTFANKEIYKKQGQDFSDQDVMRLLKFTELRAGTTDPTIFGRELNTTEKMFTTDAGRLRSLDLVTASRQGAAMIHSLSDVGMFKLLPLFQSFGGMRTMTGFSTMQTALEKGQNMKTGKRAAAEFMRLGIFGPNGKLRSQYLNELNSDPVGFVNDVLLPAYSRHGIKTDAQTNAETNMLFTNTASRDISQVRAQEARIAASARLTPIAADVGQSWQTALKTQSGTIGGLGAAYDQFATALGKLTNPGIIKGISALTDIFLGLAKGLTGISSLVSSPLFSKLMHPFDTVASAAQAGHAAGVSPGQTIHNINIDGKQVAQAITPHLTAGMGLAQWATSSGYNNAMHQTPPVASNIFNP